MKIWQDLPALPCILAWSAGVWAGLVLLPATSNRWPSAILLGGSVVAAVIALVIRPLAWPLMFGALLLGAARSELAQPDARVAAQAESLAGQRTTFLGTIAGDPTITAEGYQTQVAARALTPSQHAGPWEGRILVQVRGSQPPEAGDQVQVLGTLALPVDTPGFDRRAYLARQGIYLTLRDAHVRVVEAKSAAPWDSPARIRTQYQAAISRLLPQPEAGLVIAIVLGVKTGIPPRLNQDLIATGLIHLLVLSGLKVAVFARLALAALRPLLARWALPLTALLIGAYCLVGGATPAALRAGAMGIMTLMAAYWGRPAHVWTTLGASAAVMLVFDPTLIWDIGFQLTFAGTTAIILLASPIERWLRWLPHPLREPFSITCAAEVGTLPVMADGFHLISPVAPLANALVLPLLPALILAGLLISALALTANLGRLVAVPIAACLQYVEQIAGQLSRLPGASISLPSFDLGSGVAYYLALGGLIAASGAQRNAKRVTIAATLTITLGITAFELGTWAWPASKATVLDVGSGQAVLLRGSASSVLIDGGPDPGRLAAALGAALPPWQKQLTALILTGPSPGHLEGLSKLDYGVSTLLLPEGPQEGSLWQSTVFSLVARGARVEALHAGMRLRLAGLIFEVLAPEPRAQEPGQLALRVVGPRQSFCDLADLDMDQQEEAASHLTGGCGSLLIPRGGLPVPDFLNTAQAGKLILSDAASDRAPRGLPPTSLRTSQEGSIELPL
jgi:competence protein ComEC